MAPGDRKASPQYPQYPHPQARRVSNAETRKALDLARQHGLRRRHEQKLKHLEQRQEARMEHHREQAARWLREAGERTTPEAYWECVSTSIAHALIALIDALTMTNKETRP